MRIAVGYFSGQARWHKRSEGLSCVSCARFVLYTKSEFYAGICSVASIILGCNVAAINRSTVEIVILVVKIFWVCFNVSLIF